LATIASISFRDGVSKDDAFIGVRVEQGLLGLAVSVRGGGDIEVFLGAQAARELIRGLTRATELLPGALAAE
jgi:hypothetical protein